MKIKVKDSYMNTAKAFEARYGTVYMFHGYYYMKIRPDSSYVSIKRPPNTEVFVNLKAGVADLFQAAKNKFTPKQFETLKSLVDVTLWPENVIAAHDEKSKSHKRSKKK